MFEPPLSHRKSDQGWSDKFALSRFHMHQKFYLRMFNLYDQVVIHFCVMIASFLLHDNQN